MPIRQVRSPGFAPVNRLMDGDPDALWIAGFLSAR